MQRQSLYQDVWKSRQHQRDAKASPIASTVSSMRRGKSAPLLTGVGNRAEDSGVELIAGVAAGGGAGS